MKTRRSYVERWPYSAKNQSGCAGLPYSDFSHDGAIFFPGRFNRLFKLQLLFLSFLSVTTGTTILLVIITLSTTTFLPFFLYSNQTREGTQPLQLHR